MRDTATCPFSLTAESQSKADGIEYRTNRGTKTTIEQYLNDKIRNFEDHRQRQRDVSLTPFCRNSEARTREE